MESTLRVLSLKSLAIWPRFADDPAKFPKADAVQGALERKGVVFAVSDSCQVNSDGTVYVTSVTDPTAAWEAIADFTDPREAALRLRLRQALALRTKIELGTATATDRDTLLRLLTSLCLKLFQEE